MSNKKLPNGNSTYLTSSTYAHNANRVTWHFKDQIPSHTLYRLLKVFSRDDTTQAASIVVVLPYAIMGLCQSRRRKLKTFILNLSASE